MVECLSFLGPLISALYLACEAVNWKTIIATWRHAPQAYLQGKRTMYLVYVQNQRNRKILKETHDYYREKLIIFNLDSNTEYKIWITAFTSIGEGKASDKVSCTTPETGTKLSY